MAPSLPGTRRTEMTTPNTALQRTRSAPLRSPLSFRPLGAAIKPPAGGRQSPGSGFAGAGYALGRSPRTTTPARGLSTRPVSMPVARRAHLCQN